MAKAIRKNLEDMAPPAVPKATPGLNIPMGFFYSPSGPQVQQRLGGGAKTTESLLFLLELSPCFHRTTAGLCLEEHCYPASSLASLAQVGLSSFSSKMLANGAEATGPQAEPAPKHQQCPWPPGRREPGGEVSFLKIFGGREFSGCSHW